MRDVLYGRGKCGILFALAKYFEMRITKHKPDRDRVFLLSFGVSPGSIDSMTHFYEYSSLFLTSTRADEEDRKPFGMIAYLLM
jgi:hypothetical protein